MGKILLKEMKLSASILSYVFIVFGLMFLLPGYPVLCGAFLPHWESIRVSRTRGKRTIFCSPRYFQFRRKMWFGGNTYLCV